MTIRRILVPLPSSADPRSEIETALSAAKSLQAHVEAMFISAPPAPVPAASYAYGGRSVAAIRIDNYAVEREQQIVAARNTFVDACAAADFPILRADEQPGVRPAAAWREVEGSYVETAVRRAVAFDLMVAASAAVLESLKDIAEQSLLQARRPVLLAPSHRDTPLTDTAMIAWDESPECWHAVSAAIPFLKRANKVHVVSVDRDAGRRRASQAEVLAYLRCHGIDAVARVVAPHLRSVGETLLSVAGEDDTGMLVMGAYSHSRWREMLLGGATHHILQHAVSRPIFLMH
jgi:nucleotide-binding universal stress UspA family protein